MQQVLRKLCHAHPVQESTEEAICCCWNEAEMQHGPEGRTWPVNGPVNGLDKASRIRPWVLLHSRDMDLQYVINVMFISFSEDRSSVSFCEKYLTIVALSGYPQLETTLSWTPSTQERSFRWMLNPGNWKGQQNSFLEWTRSFIAAQTIPGAKLHWH